MAVYFKFKSARDYDSVAMDGPYITLDALKKKIFESKYKVKKDSNNNRYDSKKKYLSITSDGLCLGTDLDLQVFNAQTNEEYLDGDSLISTNTRVLLRRVPGNRKRQPIDITPIVVGPPKPPELDQVVEDKTTENAADEWDDFGDDIYVDSISAVVPDQTRKQSVADVAKSGTKAIASNVNGQASCFVRTAWRGFSNEKTKPVPKGYVCRRCDIPGHFIQDCPTNGDPNYDFKRVRGPAGIPKSMLEPNPDGTYKLSSGACAVLKANEAAFDKEMEGLSSFSSRSVNFPPELHCPLCKQVMKYAVVTSKCCVQSFCDKCIRDHLITRKSKCFCGATDILADYLIPNMTVRDTIKHILESATSGVSSSSNEKSITSPSLLVQLSENSLCNGSIKEDKKPVLDSHMATAKKITAKGAEASKTKLESALDRSIAAAVAGEEVQQIGTINEKRKRISAPRHLYQAAKRYLPSVGPCAYINQYRINGLQLGMERYMTSRYAAGGMPYAGYGY